MTPAPNPRPDVAEYGDKPMDVYGGAKLNVNGETVDPAELQAFADELGRKADAEIAKLKRG